MPVSIVLGYSISVYNLYSLSILCHLSVSSTEPKYITFRHFFCETSPKSWGLSWLSKTTKLKTASEPGMFETKLYSGGLHIPIFIYTLPIMLLGRHTLQLLF